MTSAELQRCRSCGTSVSSTALTCPSCGAIRPATPADELGAEIATGEAHHAQVVGAVLFFGGMVLAIAAPNASTWGLLGMGAGLIMVIAGRIDRNRARRRRDTAPPP